MMTPITSYSFTVSNFFFLVVLCPTNSILCLNHLLLDMNLTIRAESKHLVTRNIMQRP